MKGNHLADKPVNQAPKLSEREKRLLLLLYEDGAFADGGLSYSAAATILGWAYPQDNRGKRSRDGIYRFLQRNTTRNI
jgi:hypothetical protein